MTDHRMLSLLLLLLFSFLGLCFAKTNLLRKEWIKIIIWSQHCRIIWMIILQDKKVKIYLPFVWKHWECEWNKYNLTNNRRMEHLIFETEIGRHIIHPEWVRAEMLSMIQNERIYYSILFSYTLHKIRIYDKI